MNAQPGQTPMHTARRMYVYGIAAIAMAMTAVGAAFLLQVVVSELLSALTGGDWYQGGRDWERQRISLFLPFVAIAAPIWLLHWWLAERSMRDDREAERQSPIRAVYFTLALAASGFALITASVTMLQNIIARLFGERLEMYEREETVTTLSVAVVVGVIWALHWQLRQRDVRAGEMSGAADWLPRLYLYAAAAIGVG
jgi:hypothetical protein